MSYGIFFFGLPLPGVFLIISIADLSYTTSRLIGLIPALWSLFSTVSGLIFKVFAISEIVNPSIPPIIGLYQKNLKKSTEISDILLDKMSEKADNTFQGDTTMKTNERGVTNFYQFPTDETDAVMADMEKAAKTGNLAALQKCAGLMAWLYKEFKGDPCRCDEPFEFDGCEFESVEQFNEAWKKEVKTCTA